MYQLTIHLKNSTPWYQTKNNDDNCDGDDKQYYIPETGLNLFHVCCFIYSSKQPYKVDTIIVTTTWIAKVKLWKTE